MAKPQKSADEKPWLLTPGNIVVAVLCAVMVGVAIWKYQQSHQLDAQTATLVQQEKYWQAKVDKLDQKNNRVIYLPQAHDMNLSATQRATISNLNDIFGQFTTFNNMTGYQTVYSLAQKTIHDKAFFSGFMKTPDVINTLDLKYKNMRTQVIVTGKDSYQVFVTFIPYHDNSDLYQEAKLQVMTQVFDVKGRANDYDYARLNNRLIVGNGEYTVGDLSD